MDFFSLQCFLEVAKELNFTRAAANLYITQQNLSLHIKKLEDYYGVRLLERRPRVRLTYAGTLLLEAAQNIQNIDKQLQARLSYMVENNYGSLRIGISPARVQGFLPLIVPLFHRQYPNVTLTLVEDHTAQLEEKLQKGDLDVVISSRFHDTRLDNPLFSYLNLMCERLFFLVSDQLLHKHYPAASGEELAQKGVYMRELMDVPLILSPARTRIHAAVEQLFLKEGRKPNQLIVSNRGSSMLSLCRQGYCAALILEMILISSAAEMPQLLESLHVIPLRDETLLNTVALVYRKDEVQPKYMLTFMEMTKEIFQRNFHAGQG